MLQIQPSDFVPTYAFDPGDEVVINGTPWEFLERRGTDYLFLTKSGAKRAEQFSATELAHFVRLGKLSHEPAWTRTPQPAESEADIAAFLATRTEEQHRLARRREALVLSFLGLQADGVVKCTDASIKANKALIATNAGEINAAREDEDIEIPRKFSARSLRRWKNAFLEFGRPGLYDNAHLRGNRDRRLRPEVLAIIGPIIDSYMAWNCPTKEQIYEDVRDAIAAENNRRREAGLPELVRPSRETVRERINLLDPYQVCLAREGEEVARKKFGPVGRGVEVSRPLQRVEIDEWRADLVTLLSEAGLYDWLGEDERRKYGLDNGKVRVLVTVAICVVTKCIVGMKIAREGSSDSARQTVEMILDDKGVWSDAVGALTPWHMSGRPSLIVTDCVKYNISEKTRRSVAAINSRLLHCPAGVPEMKAVIERVFRTMATKLMPRLSGRTFGDVVTKGDRDPENEAALTIEDFCEVLVRWVVDIYHRTPHRSLGGAAPLDYWNRLVKEFGVVPAPDKKVRMLAFGNEETRVIQKNGITRMGIRYHDDPIAEWMLHNADREVRILWHHQDIGSILVEIDGEWIEVRDVFGLYDEVSARTWEETCKALRASNARAAELHVDVVRETMAHIKERNADAMRHAGLIVEEWPADRVQRAEEDLFMGFNVVNSPRAEPTEMSFGNFGYELKTGVGHVVAPSAGDRSADSISSTISGNLAETVSVPEMTNTSPDRRRTGRRTRREASDADWSFEE